MKQKTVEPPEHGLIMPRSQELINYAYEFAKEAHGNQKRKYTGEPYVTHPVAVAKILMKYANPSVDMVCAALLHDVVEDTEVTYEDLVDSKHGFMWPIANLVMDLTDVAELSDGNRETRVTINRRHTANSHPDAMTIKLADLIHNTESIVEHDPSFAIVYMEEKYKLMQVLTQGNKVLYDMANERISGYYLSMKHRNMGESQ